MFIHFRWWEHCDSRKNYRSGAHIAQVWHLNLNWIYATLWFVTSRIFWNCHCMTVYKVLCLALYSVSHIVLIIIKSVQVISIDALAPSGITQVIYMHTQLTPFGGLLWLQLVYASLIPKPTSSFFTWFVVPSYRRERKKYIVIRKRLKAVLAITWP